uniref:Uncharacterized protein n=1 Tax=Alexandrium catenella TaxID=2925 RepID=A0A6T9NSL0_ALECA
MALLRLAGFSQALALAALAAPAALSGEEVHCIRDRAHLVRFDVAGEPNDGSSMEGIERALISMEPSPGHADHCRGELGSTPSGEKHFCYGVNQDESCAGAKAALPIEGGIECKNCFVSATADAFYKLNYSMTALHSVSVGLRDIHLRASAGIHRGGSESQKAVGNMTYPGSDKPLTLINRLVGCPVCVKVNIQIGAPTTLEYDLSWSHQEEAEAGAAFHMNLGNDIVHYDSAAGWSHESHSPEVEIKPMLVTSTKASADLKLALKTSLQLKLGGIVWYHLNMNASLPIKVTFDGGFGPFKKAKTCLDGEASFKIGHEADLDWSFLKWSAKNHWGPTNLYSWSKPDIHLCEQVAAPRAPNTSLLVV